MDFKGQHIISTKQFDKQGLQELFVEADKMFDIVKNQIFADLLKGKIMATLFFEPSTRTRFSFESAMLRLGGKVISNADMMTTSSLKKRETLEDTGKVVSQMVDVIVMRHPEVGSVQKLATFSDVPVMNAGDGAYDHPTQGLLDVYTILKEKGRLDGLTVGIVGDLKFGRVAHSQCRLLKHFNVKFVFVSPEALKMPEEIVQELKDAGREVEEEEDLESVINTFDVISMLRVQEERFENKQDYEKYAGKYILDENLMEKAKDKSIVIHPLPRVDEIAFEVDKDERAKYFKQPFYGMIIRMALLSKILL